MDCDTFSKELDHYFKSYEDIEVHRLMISDRPRTEAYRRAILENKHLFEDKIVMDVGAGTGILSLFAASGGAKKVYAVEATSTANIITSIAKENNFSEIIVVLCSKVEDIVLPNDEKVDIIISEWMGFYLLHESMLESVVYARDKFLADDGCLFPSHARLYCCPCSLDTLYNEQINYWDEVYGFKMLSIKKLLMESKATKPEICYISSSECLSDPLCVKDFDLKYTTKEDFFEIKKVCFVDIKKSGNFKGLCLWFECDFDGRRQDANGREFGNCITLSTAPNNPPTHWKQTAVVFSCESEDLPDLYEKYKVEKDEVVGWELHLIQSSDNYRWYNMSIQTLDPELCEHPVPCSCSLPACVIIAKMIEQGNKLYEVYYSLLYLNFL